MRVGFAENSSSFLPMNLSSRSGGPLEGMTILVVEESHLSSEMLRMLCIRLGARLRRANNIASAMRHLQSYRPSVVIVEMCLRDGPGVELIRSLNAMKPRVQVILGMSARPDDKAEALEAGANGFICKPVDNVAEFQHVITSALPADFTNWKLSAVCSQRIAPDDQKLADDLSHGMTLLEHANAGECLGYAASFLVGIAAIANDPELRDSAHKLADKVGQGLHGSNDIEPVRTLLQQRLNRISTSDSHQMLTAISGRRLI